jgi:PRTRC genetic system protein B
MEADVRLGGSRTFTLQGAIMIYGDRSYYFATRHSIAKDRDGSPYLLPGQCLTHSFLRKLARGLGKNVAPEYLPKRVLARTPDVVVWWTPAARRAMFFAAGEEGTIDLNGHVYPHPALVFKVSAGQLFVRALSRNRRPKPDTRLRTAPYWNTACTGEVCPGTMRVPETGNLNLLSEWEEAYFRSEFTHPSGLVRLTKHPGGFAELWKELRDGECSFPTSLLVDAHQTLAQFIDPESDGR